MRTGVALLCWLLAITCCASTAAAPRQRLLLAVLGDSDSQSYQTRLAPASQPPGGAFAAHTLQWTEVLERLSGDELDLGRWDVWGTHRAAALLLHAAGRPARTPQKEDFAYNFAFGGARCNDLNQGPSAQLAHLLSAMDRDPAGWSRGVVVIRIGIVDVGTRKFMDQLARDPQAPAVMRSIDNCVQRIQDVVRQVHARHSEARFVVAGIFDDQHWPPYLALWQSARESRNIAAGLDRFDARLRSWTQQDARLAFLDDRLLFATHFGTRDAQGKPAYTTWSPVPHVRVSVSQGDSPEHVCIANGHSGLPYNILWAQALVDLMNTRFTTGLRPISRAQAVQLLAQAMANSAPGH